MNFVRSIAVLVLAPVLVSAQTAPAALQVVAEGQARAVIVLPAQPSRVAEYAAQELAYHVRKASGAALPIVKEGGEPAGAGPRICIGPTEAAARAGIDPGKLAPDSFVMRTNGDALCIAGRDSGGKPLDPDTWAGTLFGVYELLEEVMGVRWLWPGELGEHVPAATNISIPGLDRTESPRLLIRRLRSTLDSRAGESPGGAFSPDALKKARSEQAVWLRRQRMGHSRKMRWGHAFTGWWDRYGKEHPEWFNLLEDGRRGPQYGDRGDRAGMCVSHPGLHAQIVANWLEDCAANPGNKPNINGCENDVFGRCTCQGCKAWDAPRPDGKSYPERFSMHGIVSDRYTRFWRTLQELAAKHDSDAVVAAYAYVNYAPPPLREKLNEHVWIGLVPDAFFPRSPAEQEQCIAMWDGWAATGCRLFLRPNYTLEGYCMPYLYTHQFAAEFAHHAEKGMIATDFDSLTAMWATQGPQLYLFARWQSCLDKPVDSVLAEYYAGFGPASAQVKAYFDFWEDYTTANRERFLEAAQRWTANWALFPRMAHDCFPPASFARGRKLLADARAATAGAATIAERIEFLGKGLEHAELCAAVSRARASNDFFGIQEALERLRACRRSIEKDNVANLAYCAWIESRAFGEAKRAVTYAGQPLRPIGDEPQAAPAGLQAVSLRGDYGFLALLDGQEKFRATLAIRRVGKRDAPAAWTLVGPDKAKVASGTIPPGERAELELPAPAKGVYNLMLASAGNAVLTTLHNRHAVILDRELSLIHASGPLWFFVPPGTKKFTLTLKSPAPGETARAAILDPEGREAAAGSTGDSGKAVLAVEVPAGLSGKAWSVVPSRAPTGVLEDYSLVLGDELPAYWAQGPGRLLIPDRAGEGSGP